MKVPAYLASIAAAAVVALAIDAAPVMALCKYGTPHCANPDPGPKPPKVNTTTIPDDGWVDPDCKYYGNCNFPDDWMSGGSSMPKANSGPVRSR
jgi:hypothetical protein